MRLQLLLCGFVPVPVDKCIEDRELFCRLRTPFARKSSISVRAVDYSNRKGRSFFDATIVRIEAPLTAQKLQRSIDQEPRFLDWLLPELMDLLYDFPHLLSGPRCYCR